MIIAVLVIGGLGMAAAVALGVAANIFRVEIDPLVLEIEEALPGANCGGCGYPGCSAAAEAIAQGVMPANGCVGGGPDVQIAVAAILGVEVRETEPEVAQVGCRYPVSRADIKFNYAGVTDCRAAVLLAGGPKECPVGCLGLGSCVKACPFDALSMGSDGLPVVDEEKCTGCGTCVRTCPVGIMQLTSVSNRILNEYTWDECTAPCQRRCPAGIDVPEQIRQTALGNYEQALIVIKERNPLPLICGRICPRPCESDCRRNLVDEPVAINYLKRFVADYERLSGQRYQPFKAPATGRKVALIGGGAQGLSAAYFLARLGHSPVIFESRPELGGLLRTAIPESRLPRDVLDWEIEGILEMGVEAETSKSFGRDFNLSQLFDQGFENVFLATGGWDALLTPGREITPAPALPGIYLLMPLTMAWAAGRDVDLGHHTALVGDGRETLDTARLCLSKGAARVTVFSFVSKKQMGVTDEELSRAEAEGITVLNEAVVTRLMGVGDCLTKLAYTQGRGEERIIEVETIITASGRLPEIIVSKIVPDQEEEGGEEEEQAVVPGAETRWETTMPYPRSIDRGHDMFFNGEPVSDYWITVEAIGAGRRAAASIHKLLFGEKAAAPENGIGFGPPLLDVDHLENLVAAKPHQDMPEAAPEQKLDPNHEVELGYSEETARIEASRCLNCGLICYYRTKYH